MKLDNLIDELLILKEKGFGQNEVVMYENMFNEKPYHTTVENIKILKATFDKDKEVITLLR